MTPLLECVPNFSVGPDPDVLEALVRAIEVAGAEVLDASSDLDHARSVVTFLGTPEEVVAGALAAAEVALERIDLRGHVGIHPRVGALDVCPVVPVAGAPMSVARDAARRIGEGIAALGIPVAWYAESSTPVGRGLAELRRGGFEALREAWPEGRRPDLDAGRSAAHPTAGVSCVGARPVLLAWNVVVDGVSVADARTIAGELRERGGGFPGLRALGLELASRRAVQISMNLEDVENRDPGAVFRALEERVAGRGGRIVETEVIGMIPDALVLSATTDRLRLYGTDASRLLSRRIALHRRRFSDVDALALAGWVGTLDDVPESIREAAARLRGPNHLPPVPSESA